MRWREVKKICDDGNKLNEAKVVIYVYDEANKLVTRTYTHTHIRFILHLLLEYVKYVRRL